MNQSFHTFQSVISFTWMIHFTGLTNPGTERVMSNVCQDPRMNESYQICEWIASCMQMIRMIMSYISEECIRMIMSYISHVYEWSCHIYLKNVIYIMYTNDHVIYIMSYISCIRMIMSYISCHVYHVYEWSCHIYLKKTGDEGVMSRICSGTHVNEL